MFEQPGLPATTTAPGRSRAHRAVAALTAAVLLAGCVTTRETRIGSDDGSDPCRPQLVALDSTGNFFAEDILRGAAIGAVGGAALGALVSAAAGGRGSNIATGAAIGAVGGAVVGGTSAYLSARQQQATDQASLNRAIAGDLAAENAQLDRTQLAFDQLMDCRFGTAQRIRADLRGGRLTREQAEVQMAELRQRTQRDIQLAQTINGQISRRGGEFDTAIESVAPGTKQQVTQANARVSRPVPVQARATVPLRLRPDPASPEVAQVPARERVTLRPASNGFAQVETASGLRGYAPQASFPEARRLAARPTPAAAPSAAATGDVRSLGATNIARRDNFAESLGNAERLAQGQGFELAG
jgi:outer membrane lipoprotein SlyB